MRLKAHFTYRTAMTTITLLVTISCLLLACKPESGAKQKTPPKPVSTAQAPKPDKDESTIRIATEEYAPYISKSYADEGYLARLIRAAYQEEGIKVVFDFLPAARGLESTRNGQYVATVPWAKRDDRLKHFYFGEPLLESDKEVFFFMKKMKFEWDAQKQDYAKLKDKRIGAILGANYGPQFMAAEKDGTIQVERVTLTEQNVRKLLSGRIDLLITPERIARHAIQQVATEGMDVSRLTSSLAIQEPVEYDYVLFSKKAPQGKKFFDLFNRGLRKLKASGQYALLAYEFENSLKVANKQPVPDKDGASQRMPSKKEQLTASQFSFNDK